MAQPPFQTAGGSEVLDIRSPRVEYLKQSQDINPHVHVWNMTTGFRMDNTTTSCLLHLYNKTGSHLLEKDFEFDDNGLDWETDIDGENFSTIGEYTFIIQCNTSEVGGFVSGSFFVNPTGVAPTEPQSILFATLLFILTTLLVLSIVVNYKIDGNNEYDIGGKITKVNFNKYNKIGLFFVSYLLLIFVVFTINAIIKSLMILTFVSEIISVIHLILWILLIPIFLLTITLTALKFLLDLKLQDLAKRNLKERKGGSKSW